MTAFQIKLIAIITMTIDHVGLFFFPDVEVLRIIGRLSFPLFAWLIANGAYHTKNIKSYMLRLFVFAFISQVPFWLAFHLIFPVDLGLNIFFTLFLGLVAIYGKQKIKNNVGWMLLVMLCSFTALILNTDYGAAGVLSIVGFYVFFNNLPKLVVFQMLLFFLFFTVPAILLYTETLQLNIVGLLQPIAVTSLFFIAKYNKKEGLKAKYLFYFFYPLHLLAIYLIFVWI